MQGKWEAINKPDKMNKPCQMQKNVHKYLINSFPTVCLNTKVLLQIQPYEILYS